MANVFYPEVLLIFDRTEENQKKLCFLTHQTAKQTLRPVGIANFRLTCIVMQQKTIRMAQQGLCCEKTCDKIN